MSESGSSLIRMNKYFKLWKPSVITEGNFEYHIRPYDLPPIVKEQLRRPSAREHFFRQRVDAPCAGYNHDLGRLKVLFHSQKQAIEWMEEATEAIDKSIDLYHRFKNFLYALDD